MSAATDLDDALANETHYGPRIRAIERALEVARLAGYREAATCSGSTPFPVLDVLRILADAADHLHKHHSCDTHGWEVVREAANAAREIIAELTTKGQG